MQIVEFDRPLLPSLTRLINQHVASVPPGYALSEAQVEQTITQGAKLWAMHFPPVREALTLRTTCVLERHKVVAAGQWLITAQSHCAILWLVAQPDRPNPLQTLLHLIEASGCTQIELSRCSFGLGWFGIPESWTHLIDGLTEAGYTRSETWRLMVGESVILPEPEGDDGLKFYWHMNKPSLEWEVTAYLGDLQVGQCQVWGIPPHLEGCLAEWASIEWIEVAEAYRRQGIGRQLIAEQMGFHARRGVRRFLVWMGSENTAAHRLSQSFGFVDGGSLALMEKR